MKRNVILAVVVIVALVVMGTQGLFADFQDIEVSQGNYFQSGSLDLRVSDYQMNEYNGDGNIPIFWTIKNAWPGCDKSVFIDLENWGEGDQVVPWAYLHIKNLSCYWVVPKVVYRWINADGTTAKPPDPLPSAGTIGTGYPEPVTEPELVAEFGGIAGENATGGLVTVPGIGHYGEDCRLANHINAIISVAGPWPHADKPKYTDVTNWTVVYTGKLSTLNCTELQLGMIPNCNGIWVHASLYLTDFSEEEALAEGLIRTTYFNEGIPSENKWNDWPTNAYQSDGVRFDMAFELLQNRYIPVP
jgi:hypothetical protein